MKHFLFALGLFGISAVVSVLIIYGAARYQMREEAPVPNTVIETESVNEMEGRAAANQESIITARSQYFLAGILSCRPPECHRPGCSFFLFKGAS